MNTHAHVVIGCDYLCFDQLQSRSSFGRRDLLSLISVGSGWDVGVKAFSSPSPWRTQSSSWSRGWQTGRVWRVWDLLSQELKTSTGTTGDEHLTDTPPKRKTHNQSCFTVKTSKHLREKQNSARLLIIFLALLANFIFSCSTQD